MIDDGLSSLEATATGERDARRARYQGGLPASESGAAPAAPDPAQHRPQPRPTPAARAGSARDEPRDQSPDDAHVYRFLAQACVAAGAYSKALEFVTAGLARIPGDAGLIATRGDARAGLHDDEGASADWQLARELREGEGSEVRGASRSG